MKDIHGYRQVILRNYIMLFLQIFDILENCQLVFSACKVTSIYKILKKVIVLIKKYCFSDTGVTNIEFLSFTDFKLFNFKKKPPFWGGRGDVHYTYHLYLFICYLYMRKLLLVVFYAFLFSVFTYMLRCWSVFMHFHFLN